MCVGTDHSGVTGMIRALGLKPCCYPLLLNFFHSRAWSSADLTRAWVTWVVRVFGTFKINDRRVLIADGIKVPKEGRKMPAVKSLHQESESNSKREYIMGHSFQAVGLLFVAGALAWCVPLASRIHEGVKFTNRDKRTLARKLAELIGEVVVHIGKTYLVGDAYYACAPLARWLCNHGHHLVTRVKHNSVGNAPVATLPADSPRRGRPRKYGEKLHLWDLFKKQGSFKHIPSPLHKEHGTIIAYCCVDLLWKPLGRLVRFVAVSHPRGGRWILMSTDTGLDPVSIILMYGCRARIEVSFKVAIKTVGTYSYRFWMMAMERIKRCSGTQHLHCQPDWYRQAVKQKLEDYHKYVAVGIVAQGVLQFLSTFHCQEVWTSFRSWLRTTPSNGFPSEATVSSALSSALPEFLASRGKGSALRKLLTDHADPRIAPVYMRAS